MLFANLHLLSLFCILLIIGNLTNGSKLKLEMKNSNNNWNIVKMKQTIASVTTEKNQNSVIPFCTIHPVKFCFAYLYLHFVFKNISNHLGKLKIVIHHQILVKSINSQHLLISIIWTKHSVVKQNAQVLGK